MLNLLTQPVGFGVLRELYSQETKTLFIIRAKMVKSCFLAADKIMTQNTAPVDLIMWDSSSVVGGPWCPSCPWASPVLLPSFRVRQLLAPWHSLWGL